MGTLISLYYGVFNTVKDKACKGNDSTVVVMSSIPETYDASGTDKVKASIVNFQSQIPKDDIIKDGTEYFINFGGFEVITFMFKTVIIPPVERVTANKKKGITGVPAKKKKVVLNLTIGNWFNTVVNKTVSNERVGGSLTNSLTSISNLINTSGDYSYTCFKTFGDLGMFCNYSATSAKQSWKKRLHILRLKSGQTKIFMTKLEQDLWKDKNSSIEISRTEIGYSVNSYITSDIIAGDIANLMEPVVISEMNRSSSTRNPYKKSGIMLTDLTARTVEGAGYSYVCVN